MFGTKLFENENWVLAAVITGSLKITDKVRNISRKATKQEASYFHQLVDSMKSFGLDVSINSPTFADAAEQFCDAIMGNGDFRYQAYFGTTPEEWAKEIAAESRA